MIRATERLLKGADRRTEQENSSWSLLRGRPACAASNSRGLFRFVPPAATAATAAAAAPPSPPLLLVAEATFRELGFGVLASFRVISVGPRPCEPRGSAWCT
jgi:hypothetical protein